jgi:hypothetical protein
MPDGSSVADTPLPPLFVDNSTAATTTPKIFCIVAPFIRHPDADCKLKNQH